jgi:hypothetical protein
MSLFMVTQAHAYIFAKIGNTPFEKRQKTHLIVAGEANEARQLFQQAAVTQGYKYQEINPNDQVVFIFQHEEDLVTNENWLRARNVQILKSGPDDLDIKTFIKIADDVRSIATLDIFSHSAISYGSKLSEKSRLRANDKTLLKIKSNFMSDAYIVVHGCNSGFDEAVYYSYAFNVPAFGSLTSTDFQEKLTDGKWYFNNPQDKPAGMKVDPKCTNGLCIRLKPVNNVYSGHWGSYSGGGLPFYKAFCYNILLQKCLASMARFAMSFVSSSKLSKLSSFEEYKAVVQDMLCPITPTGTIRADCVAKLNEVPFQSPVNKILRTYSPFRGKQLQCGFNGCQIRFECNTGVNDGHCDLINTAKEIPTTLVDEYLNYTDAYRYLKFL